MEQFVTVGRRKSAVARIYMSQGTGTITINGKDYSEYFSVPMHQITVLQPLQTLDATTRYDIKVNVQGGGSKGQAEAVRMGIARALVAENEENKPALKAKSLLTRDPREVERKKPGLRKARRRTQFSKR